MEKTAKGGSYGLAAAARKTTCADSPFISADEWFTTTKWTVEAPEDSRCKRKPDNSREPLRVVCGCFRSELAALGLGLAADGEAASAAAA